MNEFCKPLIPKTSLIVVIFLLLFGIKSHVWAQDSNSVSLDDMDRLSEYTTEFYGTNDVLVNGRAYLPDHYNAKGNPYFYSENWTTGTLIINGNTFENQKILYNIELEKLILKTTVNDGDKILVLLNNEFVSSFYFGQHYFVNASKQFEVDLFPSFAEQVYSGSFIVLTRHQKSFVSEYTKNNPNGFYTKTKSVHYIFHNGEFKKLPTKKSLLEYFPEHKKQLITFMRKNKIRYKKADQNQLYKIFEYCDEISFN